MTVALKSILFSVISALSLLSLQAGAGEFSLLTADEVRNELQAQKEGAIAPLRPRAVMSPGAPHLLVLAPSVQNTVRKTPIRIEIAFQPEEGARIVPDSFRVMYGMFRLDITERLRKHGSVNEKGAVAEKAELPTGVHRLFLQVADNQGRVAERELKISVELD